MFYCLFGYIYSTMRRSEPESSHNRESNCRSLPYYSIIWLIPSMYNRIKKSSRSQHASEIDYRIIETTIQLTKSLVM